MYFYFGVNCPFKSWQTQNYVYRSTTLNTFSSPLLVWQVLQHLGHPSLCRHVGTEMVSGQIGHCFVQLQPIILSI